MAPVIRPAEDDDLEAVVALLLAADDARVLSAESQRHFRSTRPAAARLLELVTEEHGRVVACGAAGLNTFTSTPGAAWASLTVAADRRGAGVGSALGQALLEHLRGIEATKVTSFMRFTEEGERWVAARGWSRVMSGPLIAVDPRAVPAPAPPAGFDCVPLSDLAAQDVYDTMCEAALDEPTAVPNDSISFEEFLREWDDPDVDLGSSGGVVEEARVVAFAFMKIAGDRGQHGFTGTARASRGLGLATAAKRYALRAAAERGVTRVTTSNAEQNTAMRTINRRLGFEPIGEHVIVDRDL